MHRTLSVLRQEHCDFNVDQAAVAAAKAAFKVLGLFFSMEPRYWLNLQTEYDMRTVMRESASKITPRIRVFQPVVA